jgi:hypothetical protein
LNKKRPNRLPHFGCSVSWNSQTYKQTCDIIFEQNSRKNTTNSRKVLIVNNFQN